jgi:hypothetical protein
MIKTSRASARTKRHVVESAFEKAVFIADFLPLRSAQHSRNRRHVGPLRSIGPPRFAVKAFVKRVHE